MANWHGSRPSTRWKMKARLNLITLLLVLIFIVVLGIFCLVTIGMMGGGGGGGEMLLAMGKEVMTWMRV